MRVSPGCGFLVVLGSSWRAGVDLTGGWLVPTFLTAAVVVIPLAIEWTYPFRLEASPFTLLVGAGVLILLGPLWGLWVDPTLRGLAVADRGDRSAAGPYSSSSESSPRSRSFG